MKTLTLLTAALILAAPLAAQTTGSGPQRLRKQDGTGNGTPTATRTQQRLRDGSCGNPNPAGSRGANGQGARRGQNR
ncbi:MAG: hypothetical protein LWW79_08160 [Holophagaceae bacterium]|nr:hypothetical protein [Holophagaceae bacterium]